MGSFMLGRERNVPADDESRRAALGSSEPRASRPILAGVLVALVMLAATGIGARWQVGNEHDANQERLEALADETSARITTSLSRYADLLVSIAALETSGAGTSPEFERFTAGVGVGSRPGVKARPFIVEVEIGRASCRERVCQYV